MERVLVVGGAGYIGSHLVKMLANCGYSVVTFDNLSTGHRDAVCYGSFIRGDLADQDAVASVLNDDAFDAVMHFASCIQVGESIQRPDIYYRNNVANTLNLLEAMVSNGCKKLVFSSTAAIFGEPEFLPINENHPKVPLNPYGKSKWMVEQMLEDYDRAFGLKSACLRYFNAAGADPDGELGERHEPETHLIPLVLQAASGTRDSISIYGTDYDTIDGTCVRDYIHVSDLCDAHLRSLRYLADQRESCQFNLGNGNGFSVREVIEAVQRVTGRNIRVNHAPRRDGDPPVLVADSSCALSVLGWKPKYAELDDIIRHAWAWESGGRPVWS